MDRYLKFILFFVVIGTSTAIEAQEKKGFYDSVAISFLKQIYPHYNIGFRNDTSNGTIKRVHNFYAYPSFHLTTNDSLSIEVVNLGTYFSEERGFILIIDSNKNGKVYMCLGEKSLEDDLAQLTNYFESKKKILKIEYKLEILDLFLRCKNGQIKTPVYIH